MKLSYAPPSPLPMLPLPPTQSHTAHSILLLIPRVAIIPHSLSPHQHRTLPRRLRHHEVHQNILAVAHLLHAPPHARHAGPAPARVEEEVARAQKHELGEHDGEAVGADRVDPLPPVQVEVVGAREEPHETMWGPLPDAEGEVVDLDVVVAYQNGVGGDVVAGEEAVVEAGGALREEGDGGGGKREVKGKLVEDVFWGGGVSPEDED
uniref:Uncharacterized protein n=1 Tax=Cajanus cajan TaxID=3821 RepID=A0A151SSH3_CAJCA|nr:hypothetical protein KK1_004008 [Cajanus cajan]